MKWFLTTNESSLNNETFFKQLQVAVMSATTRTNLVPHLIYDGEENEKLDWLKSNGVAILPYKLSIRREVSEWVLNNSKPELLPELVDVRTGAYLKTEIPIAIRQHGIRDKYILYTDCDVIFMRDVDLQNYRPRYLAAFGIREGGYSRFRIGGWMHFNSGVLLMNVDGMQHESARFRNFVIENGGTTRRPKATFMQKNLFLSDQVALNLFYKGRIDQLDQIYNWNPTRGVAPDVRVVHFNGLKWTQWEDFLEGNLLPHRMVKFTRLVNQNRSAFEHYVRIAKNCLALAD